MAIYVPQGAKRRRLIMISAGALVLGLLVGYLVGRATAPSLDDAIVDVREQADVAATAFERLPIEYEQALVGEGGESPQTIADAIESARSQLDEAYADATWFGDGASAGTDEALDAVQQAVADGASADEFAAAAAGAAAAIRSTFGVSTDGS